MSVVDELAKIEAEVKAEKQIQAEIEAGNAFRLGKLTVLPKFDGLMRKVHPAIDVVDGRAVVGVTLPCLTVDEEGNQEERELPFLITSDRQKIPLHKDALKPLHWRLAYRIVEFENRWPLEGVKAWLEGASVNPAEVYDMVKKAYQTYIEFENPDIYDFITLWTVGTYFFHLFNTYPYVYVGGLKQAGKTKLLTVASLLAFNAIFTNNISTASLYRLTQSGRCTLLLDESEKLAAKERAEELRNLLLTGYKKGAVVYRTEKKRSEKLVPEAFEVYSPKIVCNIEGIENVLEERCIPIIMKRGKNKAIINAEPNIADPVWQQIRSRLYVLFLDYFSVVCAQSAVCEVKETNVSARDLELWRPIFTLAAFFDKYNPELNLLQKMINLASRTTEEKQVENITETAEFILVETLTKLVTQDGYFSVRQIKETMSQAYDEEQKWLSTKWLGRALKRLGFTEKRRVGRGVEYYLTLKAVQDLAERLGFQNSYVSPTSQTALNTQTTLKEALKQLTVWLIENKDSDGLVDAFALYAKIQELGLEPKQVIDVLKADGWLMDASKIGKFGVAK
ncbi:hypothetical protein KEJ24_06055 [Candidatus Bathyarchaeota archaeon]|nr:hypothetical protein [Candidatus Bathyarchaeota archaeon]